MRPLVRLACALSLASLEACSPDTPPPGADAGPPPGTDAGAAARPATLFFDGRVGGATFACGAAFPGVGTTGTELTALDLRFYVHDVRLVTTDGVEVPFALEDDGVFQDGEVALLDFEDGGACEGGNTPTHVALTGTLPDDGASYAGVRFVLGVPEARNHLDVATARSPLNVSSMFWSWTGGYKFVRVEGRTTGQPGGVLFHLGSTGCTGDPRGGDVTCARPNRAEISLTLDGGFDPASDRVVADLADLFATTDLDADTGGQPGCMSAPDDPECATIFAAAGLGDPSAQAFFHLARTTP